MDLDFRGRTWEVVVRSAMDQRKGDKKEKLHAKEQAARQQLAEDKAKVEAVLARYPAGETQNMIEPAAGLSRKRTLAAIHALVQEGAIVPTDVEKDAGKSGVRPYPGYKLAEPISDEDDELEGTEDDDDDVE